MISNSAIRGLKFAHKLTVICYWSSSFHAFHDACTLFVNTTGGAAPRVGFPNRPSATKSNVYHVTPGPQICGPNVIAIRWTNSTMNTWCVFRIIWAFDLQKASWRCLSWYDNLISYKEVWNSASCVNFVWHVPYQLLVSNNDWNGDRLKAIGTWRYSMPFTG